MRILLTGANGFLGQNLARLLYHKGYDFLATGKATSPALELNDLQYKSMDITQPFSIYTVFEDYNPNVVIHAAAMTNVDDCEKNPAEAFATNVEGTVHLLLNGEAHRSRFIFISTDFVFSGDKGNYVEDDDPDPVNYYGSTKVDAEEAVKRYDYNSSIVRTSLVYGKPVNSKNNLLSVVREKLRKKEVYRVVDDQVRTPTYVEDLADGIIAILEKNAQGTFHISGKDILTPYQMAYKAAKYLNEDVHLLERVTAENFSQAARRPLKTNLSNYKAYQLLNYAPIGFEEGLKKTMDELIA